MSVLGQSLNYWAVYRLFYWHVPIINTLLCYSNDPFLTVCKLHSSCFLWLFCWQPHEQTYFDIPTRKGNLLGVVVKWNSGGCIWWVPTVGLDECRFSHGAVPYKYNLKCSFTTCCVKVRYNRWVTMWVATCSPSSTTHHPANIPYTSKFLWSIIVFADFWLTAKIYVP